MTKEEYLRLGGIIVHYEGGCEMLSDEDMDYLYVDHPKTGVQFDEILFRCETCSWWFEVGDETLDPDIFGTACKECHPYEE